MTSLVACPCGRVDAKKRAVAYADCCGRFVEHFATTPAPDAERLMRSRYTAFVRERADYLLAPWHPSHRPSSVAFEPGVKWLGLEVRAVTQNRRMASAIGIRTPWIGALTFAVGSGIAGIAGVGLSQIDNVSPDLGQGYSIDSFMVVVFGGVGNLWGTLVAAMTLGIVNKLLEPFAGAVLGKIFVLIFIILFIQKRPRGLFALKGRFVDA